jgi:hypothetical protein
VEVRVYRTRHAIQEAPADMGGSAIVWFDCEPPEPGARPIGMPRWSDRGDVVWQTWWSGEKPRDEERHE